MSISVCIVTRNRKDYLKRCLDSLLNQSCRFGELIIVDNGSDDGTVPFIKENYPQCRLIENNGNLGQDKGRNQAIGQSKGEYVFCLDDDLILDKNYLEETMKVFPENKKAGSVQGKILQYDLVDNQPVKKDTIDSLGFRIFRSRRIVDWRRGERDIVKDEKAMEIFAPNTAAVVFRKEALEQAKIGKEYFDEDFFRQVEDVDFGWRLRLLGWQNFYQPAGLAWHDSHSSKKITKGYRDFIRHRRSQPSVLRKLDYRNQLMMFVKNEFFGHLLSDSLYFLWRQARLFAYILIFEPLALTAIPEFFGLLPRMLKKRKIIKTSRKITSEEIKRWFE